MSKVIVLVLSWNGEAYVRACLDALAAQQYDDAFAVLVVDNASTDRSVEIIRSYPVMLIQSDYNRGFAGGNNLGLCAIRDGTLPTPLEWVPDTLILLNQDTEVAPDWLAEIEATFVRHPDAGIVGCKSHTTDGTTLQHAGGVLVWPLGTGMHRGAGEPDTGQYDHDESVEFVTGAALALRMQLLETVGMLDEGFAPAYYEDTDYCFRARAAGYEIVYAPRAHLIHHEGTSLVLESPAHQYAYHRNRVHFLLKHGALEDLEQRWVPAELEEITRWSTSGSLTRKRAYVEGLLALPQLCKQRAGSDDAGRAYDRLCRILRRLHRAVSEEEHQQRVKTGYRQTSATRGSTQE
jgi:GT2 family glycosyltransferase